MLTFLLNTGILTRRLAYRLMNKKPQQECFSSNLTIFTLTGISPVVKRRISFKVTGGDISVYFAGENIPRVCVITLPTGFPCFYK